MKDQVSALSAKRLAVGCVTSESSGTRYKINGLYQLVFFSPEALLGVHRWRQMLQGELYSQRIVAFIVDEAHCAKKWQGE